MEVCVVVPVYHSIPENNELLAINSVMNHLGELDIFFIAPNGIDTSWYRRNYPDVVIRAYKRWNNSIQSYSKLLLSKRFYQEYSGYKYMLICQTDALVLGSKEDLFGFCNLDYDYYGAPWEPFLEHGGREIPKYRLKKWQKISLLHKLAKVRRCEVGNGGFSLRKIDAMLHVLDAHKVSRMFWNYNEDLFLSYYCKSDSMHELNIAPTAIAMRFARENGLKEAYVKGNLPFGVHAWEKDWPEGINFFSQIL